MLIFKTYCAILLLQWTEDTRGYKNGIATLYSTVDKKYTSCNNSIQSQSLYYEREFWTAHYQIINVFCPVNMICNKLKKYEDLLSRFFNHSIYHIHDIWTISINNFVITAHIYRTKHIYYLVMCSSKFPFKKQTLWLYTIIATCIFFIDSWVQCSYSILVSSGIFRQMSWMW
jgi:hypothetical protein